MPESPVVLDDFDQKEHDLDVDMSCIHNDEQVSREANEKLESL